MDAAKPLYGATVNSNNPNIGAFNERVSVDLIGPLHRTERGNEYIVVMQDHFTKWIEGAAVPTKEAMIVYISSQRPGA